jgi:hypothetical protein
MQYENSGVADDGEKQHATTTCRREYRRVVTGRDGSGRSFLLDDRVVHEGAMGNLDLWQSGPGTPDVGKLLGGVPIPFVPAPGGSLVRLFRLPPEGGATTAEERLKQATEFSKGIGLPGCQPDTSRHPFMHVTPTTDYLMVLAGEVSLLLDEGEPIELLPFDVVIQRQTNHAWINTGATDAYVLSVMISVPDR